MHNCEPAEDTFNNDLELMARNEDERFDYAHGPAIEWCREYDGVFIVGNSEYATRVNFCPFCGAKAPKQSAGELAKVESKVIGDTIKMELFGKEYHILSVKAF